MESVGLGTKLLKFAQDEGRCKRQFLRMVCGAWRSSTGIGTWASPIPAVRYELPLWIVNSMRMFADDTKLWAYIRSEADSQSLQRDLDKLVEWSNEWQLGFNPAKSKVML